MGQLISRKSNLKETNIFQAIDNNDYYMVHFHLLNSENCSNLLKQKDKYGNTPVLKTCQNIHDLEILRLLKSFGGSLHECDSYGNTPLHYSVLNESYLLCDYLLENKVELAKNRDGDTPLDLARLTGNSTMLRLIENHISLFSGYIRTKEEKFSSSIISSMVPFKRRFIVIMQKHNGDDLPEGFRIITYSSKDCTKPRKVIPLHGADILFDNDDNSRIKIHYFSFGQSTKTKQKTLLFKIQEKLTYEAFAKALTAANSPFPATLLHLDSYCDRNSGRSSISQVNEEIKRLGARNSSISTYRSSFSSSHSRDSNIKKHGECSICMDGPQDSIAIPCGHNGMCLKCAKILLLSGNNASCPICRKTISQVVEFFPV